MCLTFVPHFEALEAHSFCASFGAHKKPITLSLTNKLTSAPYFVPQMCLTFVPHFEALKAHSFCASFRAHKKPKTQICASFQVLEAHSFCALFGT